MGEMNRNELAEADSAFLHMWLLCCSIRGGAKVGVQEKDELRALRAHDPEPAFAPPRIINYTPPPPHERSVFSQPC